VILPANIVIWWNLTNNFGDVIGFYQQTWWSDGIYNYNWGLKQSYWMYFHVNPIVYWGYHGDMFWNKLPCKLAPQWTLDEVGCTACLLDLRRISPLRASITCPCAPTKRFTGEFPPSGERVSEHHRAVFQIPPATLMATVEAILLRWAMELVN
jgi:hypothetical protein